MPAHLEPYQEKRQGGKASIYGVILGDPNLKNNITPLENLVKGARDDPCDEGRFEMNLCVGHKHVHEDEEGPNGAIGQQLEHQEYKRTHCTQQGDLFNDALDLTRNQNGHSTGHDKKHRTDKHEGEIIGNFSCERPRFLNAPDVIK